MTFCKFFGEKKSIEFKSPEFCWLSYDVQLPRNDLLVTHF